MGLEPTTSCLHDKGTTTRAKGEPEVVGRGSGSYPVEVHCYAAFLSGRGQIVQMGEYEVGLRRLCRALFENNSKPTYSSIMLA